MKVLSGLILDEENPIDLDSLLENITLIFYLRGVEQPIAVDMTKSEFLRDHIREMIQGVDEGGNGSIRLREDQTSKEGGDNA